MGKQSRSVNSEKKKVPRSYPKQPGAAEGAGIAVGRAELAQLSSAVLYELLVLKNVPGRSKVRSKAARERVLEGRVTTADYAMVGLLPIDSSGESGGISSPRKQFHVTLPRATTREQPRISTPRVRKPAEGVRFEVPVAGIDVHVDPLVVAIADPTGIIAEERFPYSEGGLDDIKRFLQLHHVGHVAMESTAEYWIRVFWSLKAAGIDALVANPVQTKAVQGQKTDDYDAQRIALAFRDGRLKPSVLCTPEQYTRRKLNRDATKRTKQGAKAASRLKMMFHVFGAPDWVAELYETQRGRRVLHRCLALETVFNIKFDDVQRLLAQEFATGKGKVDDPTVLLKMAAEMVVLLFRLDKVPGNRLRLAENLEEFASNRRLAEQLRAEVLRQIGKDPALWRNLQLLLSIPGVGEDTALTILVEIVDVRFFWSAKALSKWAGLAARVNQSGHKKRVTGHIYKGGNKWLREACYLVAKTEHAHAGKEGHPVGAFARRLQHAEKKSYKVAVTAAARHVLTYAYHVLAEQKTFEALWTEELPARVEANRQRKLRVLKKSLDQATVDDLLPCVIAAIRRKCDELQDAENTCATLIRGIFDPPPMSLP